MAESTPNATQQEYRIVPQGEFSSDGESDWSNDLLAEPLRSKWKQKRKFLRQARNLNKTKLEKSLDCVKQHLYIVDKKVNYAQRVAHKVTDDLEQYKEQINDQQQYLDQITTKFQDLRISPNCEQQTTLDDKIQHLTTRFEKLCHEHDSLDSYAQFIADRANIASENCQRKIKELCQKQTDVQRLQRANKQTLEETFKVVDQTTLIILQNLQHYASIQTFSHNEFLKLIAHLIQRDTVLTRCITELQKNQHMHHCLLQHYTRESIPLQQRPPRQFTTPPLPAPLPVIEAPEYPDFLVHAPEYDPDIDVHPYEQQSSEPETESELGPKTIELRRAKAFQFYQQLPREIKSAQIAGDNIRYHLVKGRWKKAYFNIKSRYGAKSRSPQAYARRSEKFKQKYQKKLAERTQEKQKATVYRHADE